MEEDFEEVENILPAASHQKPSVLFENRIYAEPMSGEDFTEERKLGPYKFSNASMQQLILMVASLGLATGFQTKIGKRNVIDVLEAAATFAIYTVAKTATGDYH